MKYAKDNPGDVVGTFLHVLKKFAKIALIITGVIVGIIVILFIILLIIGYMMNF